MSRKGDKVIMPDWDDDGSQSFDMSLLGSDEAKAPSEDKKPEVAEVKVVKRGLLGRMQDAVNVTSARKVIKFGFEASGALQPFLDKPNWWNAGRATFAIAKLLLDDIEVWPDLYFDDEEKWQMPYSRDFTPLITPLLSKYPVQVIQSNESSLVIKLVDVDGMKMGYVYNTKLNSADSLYVETPRLADAKAFIKKELWAQYKQSSLVMRNNRKNVSYNNEARIIFEPDDAFNPLPSMRATKYAMYLRRCVDAGVSRSVMLFGPPGTGKSTMSRTLVEELHMRSFRIRVEDIGYTENSVIFEAIAIFQPDVIILDDFDRCHNQAQLLETLEFFKRHVKLVIATVNNRASLDEAILRPGRFDELVYVDEMEEPVVRKMLGDYQDAYDVVKGWPIAFIEEYVIRRRFMSKEETEASLKELISRVARLRNYRDSDEDDIEGKFLNKALEHEEKKLSRRPRRPRDTDPADIINAAFEEGLADEVLAEEEESSGCECGPNEECDDCSPVPEAEGDEEHGCDENTECSRCHRSEDAEESAPKKPLLDP